MEEIGGYWNILSLFFIKWYKWYFDGVCDFIVWLYCECCECCEDYDVIKILLYFNIDWVVWCV